MERALLMGLLLTGYCPWGLSASPPVGDQELAHLLTQMRVQHNLPGIRAAIYLANGQIIRAASGLADQEQQIPLGHQIGMPGGSTGKIFVAAVTMLLIEDGVLQADDRIGRWLPELTQSVPWLAEIQVQHLLSHSSGIADYPGTWGFQTRLVWRALRHGSARFEPEELIHLATRQGAQFKAGEGFLYTDAGYLVLGRLLEAVSGQSYFDLLQAQILVPHGLTEIRPQEHSVSRNIAAGYTRGARNLKPDGRMRFDPVSEWTGGGLITNPTALATFLHKLAGGQIVSPASLHEMTSAGWRDPATPEQFYGYGLFINEADGTFGHGGMWPGYRTHVTHFPSSSTTIAVQTNRDGALDMPVLVEEIRLLVQAPQD